MKNQLTSLFLSTSKIKRDHIQTLLVVLTLAMLVLGLGAPEDMNITGR